MRQKFHFKKEATKIVYKAFLMTSSTRYKYTGSNNYKFYGLQVFRPCLCILTFTTFCHCHNSPWTWTRSSFGSSISFLVNVNILCTTMQNIYLLCLLKRKQKKTSAVTSHATKYRAELTPPSSRLKLKIW